jgi:hypothetical protein
VLGRRPPTEPVWTEDALNTLFTALFDLRHELLLIRRLLEDGDGPEETEEAADDS